MDVKYYTYYRACQTVGEGLDFISYMQAAGQTAARQHTPHRVRQMDGKVDELLVGALLWVKLESEVKLRVPKHRDSIFTRVTQGFNWALGTGDHFHAVLFPMGAGSGRRGWMRQDTT